MSLLASFGSSFPLRNPSTVASADMARYLLAHSEGNIGELTLLLTEHELTRSHRTDGRCTRTRTR